MAVSELELSVDVLISILGREPGRLSYCDPRNSFEDKVEYLANISHSRLLKHDWWRLLRRIAERAKVVQSEHKSFAMASVYGRGAGQLEQTLRLLVAKAGIAPRLVAVTPAKVNAVREEATNLAGDSCQLAASLLRAAEKLSIDLSGVSRDEVPPRG